MAYEVGYPINYTPGGDTTNEALAKGGYLEHLKIYSHLNELQGTTAEQGRVKISSVVDSVGELPEAEAIGTVYMAGSKLYIFNGVDWAALPVKSVREATEDTYGGLSLGTLAGVFSDGPNPFRAITEKVLGEYDNSPLRGLPQGSVIMWQSLTPPVGWALCDGANGTPDLQHKFIRGSDGHAQTYGGSDEITVEPETLPEHTHTYNTTEGLPGHTHTFSATAGSTQVGHAHSITMSGQSNQVGNHTHSLGSRANLIGGTWMRQQTEITGLSVSDIESFYRPWTAEGNHTHSIAGTVNVNNNTSDAHTHTTGITTNTVEGSSFSGRVTTNSITDDTTGTYDNRPKYTHLVFIMKL
jgi:hypothetical protein